MTVIRRADHAIIPRPGRTLEDEYRELSAEFLTVEENRDRLAEQLRGAVERGRAEMLRDVLKVLETWDERHGHGRPDPVEYVRRRIGGQ